jgi:hypothetical protein
MICRPPVEECERDTLEIRDISHELLECLPQAANLERIRTVLKESAWGGLGSDPGMSNSKKRKRGEGRRWTRAQLDSVVQASEGEIERGLRERNVVELDGESCTTFEDPLLNVRPHAIASSPKIGSTPQPYSHAPLDPHNHPRE